MLNDKIASLFFTSNHIYRGPQYGFPSREMGDELRTSIDNIRHHYVRALAAHYFISPIDELRFATYVLRQYVLYLEDGLRSYFIEIEVDRGNRYLNDHPGSRAAARAERHEHRWLTVVKRWVRDGDLSGRDWRELPCEEFVKVITDKMAIVLSLELGAVERQREMREGGNRKRKRRGSCSFWASIKEVENLWDLRSIGTWTWKAFGHEHQENLHSRMD